MSLLQAIALGILQGLTEFIPVSSSGHLVLLPWLVNWPAPGLTFELAAHLGTSLAALVYFRDDWLKLLRGGWRGLRGQVDSDSRLLWWIIIATLPVGLVGLLFSEQVGDLFSTPKVAASGLLATAGLLFAGDRLARKDQPLETLGKLNALFIGLAQVIAIVPGISRSGATIAAGRWRNLERPSAARFSFLLALPTIVGGALFHLIQALLTPDASLDSVNLLGGIIAAGVTGYLCIGWLMGHLQKRSLTLFVVYCAAAGVFFWIVIVVRG